MKKILFLCLLICSFSARGQKLRKTDAGSGLIDKGDKTGLWEYYAYTRDGSQVITQKYDHTAKKLVFFRPFDEVPYPVKNASGEWTRQQVTHPIFFIGGDAALAPYMSKLNYPAAAQSKNVQGRVLVSIVVDTLGHAIDQQVVVGIGAGCDEEALRVARTIPDEWIPAHIGSQAVVSRLEIPFTFRLQAR
ncbi:energy transducer TonB [Hymenobacter rubripertinctus]|uniref:Energy transducer TonB n=1 Tax=Hymenobacter rubripertinctus TaxID=2029981 RepID=A0A418QPH2_9BACT|nr:energy transducer TonB [Hymenobacter rubripertinctus]RIY07093.1 energy transducer TonB [Hymenobacter rubripertinctus]